MAKRSLLLIIFGALIALAALLVPGSVIETGIFGRGQGELSWGPSLFKVLLFIHGAIIAFVGFRDRFSTSGTLQSTGSAGDRVAGWEWVILAVMTVVACALRFWHLNTDLWVDEVLMLIDFVRKPFAEMVTSFPSQNQHMLYSIIAKASIGVFGESAWAYRLPAVFFGIGSIWAIYFFARYLFGVREAILAAALMTFSYHHIWFSQNARGYTGLLCFAILATWFWLKALTTNRSRWWTYYAVAVVFGLWVHLTMAFIIAAQGLLYLFCLAVTALSGNRSSSLEHRAGLKPIIAWLLSFSVTLQLYALALPEFLRVGLHEESADSEWTNPLWLITESLHSLSVGFAGIAVVLCGGLLVGFGWFSLFRRDRRAAVLMVLPAILAGSTMLVLGYNLWPRFFFFSMGFGILIVIHGAAEFPKYVASFVSNAYTRQTAAYAGVAVAVMMVLVSAYTVPRNYALPKQNFSGAKYFVESNRLPGDVVVAVNLAGTMYGNYFAPDWGIARTGDELKNLPNSSNRVWVVYTLPIEIRSVRPDIWQVIESDFDLVQVFPGTLNGGEVFVCRSRRVSESNNEASPHVEKRRRALWQAVEIRH